MIIKIARLTFLLLIFSVFFAVKPTVVLAEDTGSSGGSPSTTSNSSESTTGKDSDSSNATGSKGGAEEGEEKGEEKEESSGGGGTKGVCTKCIKQEITEIQIFLKEVVWQGLVSPALKKATLQMGSGAFWQLVTIGTFFDASIQMDTQRVLQELWTKAYKDYRPSMQMCTIGTNSRGLVAGESSAEMTEYVLARHALDRQRGVMNNNASEGVKEDMEGRFSDFAKDYCNPHDQNGVFSKLCTGSGGPKEYQNRDIDYPRAVEVHKTLNVDFLESSSVGSSERRTEDSFFALSSNLYGNRVLPRMPAFFLTDENKQTLYLNLRSLMAKRNVASQSFNAIVAMKTKTGKQNGGAGTDSAISRAFTKNIMKQLNPNANVDKLRYTKSDLSYYEQMEFLTKRLYQDPTFYTNLYDTPANVDRQYTAMQAIGLMQDYDTLESYLRTELMLSVLVGMEIDKLQAEVEGRGGGA